MDTIKLLISLGADIGSSINNLKHRLMEAESGKIAKSLIDRDDITSSINGDGITSIERYLISLIPKNEEATAQLIRAVSSEDSHTPIGLIISYIADGADINGMTAYGCSILFSSLVSRKMMLASNLITLGAAVDDDCIITSLLGEEKRELSAADDNILVIQAIINVGVDINIISNGSSTLVMILSMEQPTNYRMVELLLDNGVDPNLPSSNGSTPLCLALIRNDIENTIIRLLLEYGADPNVRCNGSTPLSLALISTSRWRDEIIEDLLSYGADPNAKCNEMTPLFLFLIHSNNHGIIKELVRYGADVNEKCNGLSPLGALVSIGDEELETIELLIKLGARVNDRIVTSTLPELDHEVDTISILELAQNNISATNVARLLMKYGAK